MAILLMRSSRPSAAAAPSPRRPSRPNGSRAQHRRRVHHHEQGDRRALEFAAREAPAPCSPRTRSMPPSRTTRPSRSPRRKAKRRPPTSLCVSSSRGLSSRSGKSATLSRSFASPRGFDTVGSLVRSVARRHAIDAPLSRIVAAPPSSSGEMQVDVNDMMDRKARGRRAQTLKMKNSSRSSPRAPGSRGRSPGAHSPRRGSRRIQDRQTPGRPG